MSAPGPFFYLEREGVVSTAQLEPLLSRLPPEQIVRTGVRDGEGFDSRRWPVELDARLASFVARRFGLPLVDATLAAIERAAGDPRLLRALARQASARVLANAGADFALFSRLWHDADEDDRRVFAAPSWPLEAAHRVEWLTHAHHHAKDGLYAYHVTRGLPGPGAEAAAHLARAAIEAGHLTAEELVAAAIELVTSLDGAPRD